MKSSLIHKGLFSCLVFFTVTISNAFTAPRGGASFLGICSRHFPCAQAMENHAGAIGYLADSFGHKCDCIVTMLSSGQLNYVRVHIANGTCFPERGRRCTRLDVFRGETLATAEKKILSRDAKLLARFRTAARRVKAIHSKASGDIIFRYSPCLECPFPAKVRSILIKEAARFFPLESLVDSPVIGKCISNVICEKHGDSPRFVKSQKCISDLDGVSFLDARLMRLKRSSNECEAIFYWTHGFNLLPYGQKAKFVEPYKRTHQPYEWEFDGLRECLESH